MVARGWGEEEVKQGLGSDSLLGKGFLFGDSGNVLKLGSGNELYNNVSALKANELHVSKWLK